MSLHFLCSQDFTCELELDSYSRCSTIALDVLIMMPQLSIKERVDSIKGPLAEMVAAHEAGTHPEGLEALAAEVDQPVDSTGLVSEEVHDIDNTGVSPGNSEDAGLVASVMHGLLARIFFVNGWNPKRCDCTALCARFPQSQMARLQRSDC